MSQAELAEKLGFSTRGYQKYEQGESWPSPETLDRICEIASVTAESLFLNGIQSSPTQSSMAQTIALLQAQLDAIPLELRDAFEKAEPEMKSLAVETALAVLQSDDLDLDLDHAASEERAPASSVPSESKQKRRAKS